MRMSKSLAVLTSNIETASPDRKRQPRRRSSLDTFVIPGRTRLPSSKASLPEPIDLRIAEHLLNAESRVPPRKSSSRGRMDVLNPPRCRRSDAPLQGMRDSEGSTPYSLPQFHLDMQPLLNSTNYDEVDVLPQEYQSKGIAQRPLLRLGRHPGEGSSSKDREHPELPISFDGLNDTSSHGSRNTTSTWTTVSHRNFTGSSAGSQRLGSKLSIEEYNRLAVEHGLVEFLEAPDSLANASRHSLNSSLTSQTHHHGWIVRKLLRRTSSTYNVKPKVMVSGLRRKRSAYALSSIQPRPRKDILKDRSLEEISRLGGLSILALPRDFAAIDKLVLPSCVSATAHHLVQHGCTAPGIFRVPGQLSTINALYDYYSNRFLNYSTVDDPDQIQSTVGTGDLPTHIEYTVHDVASLLKKILLGLPGGLLGSLSLFKAIYGIDAKIQRNPEQSEADVVSLKARLIALAISSVSSDHRFSLICAILGLAALIGHESEQAANGRSSGNGQSSELMGYRALGVVLGPLLLGNDINDIFGSEKLEAQHIHTPGSPKKSRKQRRSSVVDQKLGNNEALLAHVEKAKITAKVGEMLISTWKDIVKELRDLAINGPSGSRLGGSGQQPASERSKFTLSSPQDGFVKGAQPPDVFVGPSRSAKKARNSSGHSRPTRSSKTSTNSRSTDWLHDACMTDNGEGKPLLRSGEKKTSKPRQLHYPRTDERKITRANLAGHSARDTEGSLHYGERPTIPQEFIITHPFVTTEINLVPKPLYGTPEDMENPFARKSRMEQYEDRLRPKGRSSAAANSFGDAGLGLSLPSTAALNPGGTSSASRRVKEKVDDMNVAGPEEAHPRAKSLAEGPQERNQMLADSFGTLRGLDEFDADKGLLISNAEIPKRAPRKSDAFYNQHASSRGPDRNSVTLLAQRFSQSSQGHYVPDAPEHGVAPRIYANVYAAPIETQSSPPPVPKKDTPPTMHSNNIDSEPPPPKVPEKDNHSILHRSKSDLGHVRESSIPKPVQEIGRGRRKGVSRSPSPIKEATPATHAKKNGSIARTPSDDPLDVAGANEPNMINKNPDADLVRSSATELPSLTSQQAPRAPFMRKALTTSSLKASSPLDALMKDARPSRVPSASGLFVPIDIQISERDYSPSISQDSDTGSIRKLTKTNTNSTSALFAEIRRLHRELEKKTDEVNLFRRNLDILNETGSVRERSCSREGSIYEEDPRKQLELWKRRAEEAERRLENGPEEAMERHTENSKHGPKSRSEVEQTPRKEGDGSEQSLNAITPITIVPPIKASTYERGFEDRNIPQTPIKPHSERRITKDQTRTPDRRSEAETTSQLSAEGEQIPRKASRVAFVDRSPTSTSMPSPQKKGGTKSPSALKAGWEHLL